MEQDALVQKCQENPWLKRFGLPFQEDPMMELDYEYIFTEVETVEELEKLLARGNWAIRQGFVYKNLVFINQVNGGDEWWTLKEFEDGELVAFESITFLPIIKEGKFKDLIERLLKADKEQCLTLQY
jgi:hypothetical protein